MNATHYFHKITIPGRASKFSAYFHGDPMRDSLACLVDAERIDRLGRGYPVTEREYEILARGVWSAGQAGTYATA
jgi:hypothetical protein